MIDYLKLLNVPFKKEGRNLKEGLDCYGLVKVVLEENFDTKICEFNDPGKADLINAIVSDNINELVEEIKAPEPGCIVLFAINPKYITHFGVCIGDGKFIHILKGCNVAIDKLSNSQWTSRIRGYYKWKKK